MQALAVATPGVGLRLGEPENNVIFPIDPRTKSVCTGTRLGHADVEDIELHGTEGAALLNVFQQDLYFASIRGGAAPLDRR